MKRLLVLVAFGLLLPAPAPAQIAFRAAADSSTPPIAFRAATQAGGVVFSTIAFRASAQAGAASGGLTLTINRPTGTVLGDVMLASIAVRPNSAVITAPSGWTLIRTDTTTTGPTEKLSTYQKVAGTSEPASYSWTFDTSTGSVGGILTFSGVDTGTPINVSAGQAVTGTANSTAFDVPAPSVTTTVANAMLVTAHAVASSGTSGSAWTPPTGMTEAVDISSSSGTGGESIEVNHVVQASAGATGTKTATVAGHDGGEGVAQIFALRPGANLTISVPAGTIADDVMIAAIAVRPSSVTITTPAGWTLVGRTDQGSGNTNSQAVYQRVAGAAEPASYTWTLGGAPTGAAGGIMSFSGVATVSPIATAAGAATASALTHTAPSISPIFKNTMLITSHSFSSAANWTPPSGMTEAVDVASIAVPAAGGISLEMNYEPRPADGSTGTRTATASNDADTGVARSLALQPSLRIPLPAGTVANDVMIASIAVRPSTVTITPPAGWTLVRRMDQGAGTTNSLAIYSKVAGASEPAFYTWVTSATTGAAGGIQSFSGVDTATPIDVENGASTASSLSHATPSITTTVANAMLVASFDFSSSATWTPPAGMTEGVDVASRVVPNSAGISLEASFAVQAAAGATGGKTATASNDADTGNAHILALRPSRTGAIACASAGGSNSTLDLPGVNLSGRNGVVVFVGYNNNNFETVTSVVIDPGGASQTSMGAALASAATVDDAQIYIFGLVNPPQGIFTIRVTFSAALLASHGSNICAYPLIGVNTSNPFGTPGTNANPSGNGSVVVPSAAGELVLAGLAGETIGTSTVAAPAVEDADIQGGSGTTIHHLATARQDGAAPNVTISWTHTSDHWAAAGISVRFGGPPPPGGFNAYETSTAASAITGVIKTKIAGSTASVDMIALDAAKTAIATGFTGIVRVEVLNTSDNSGALDANGCRPTWTVIQTLSPDPEFVAGDNGRKTISFTQANSFPNARLRITFPAGAPTVTGCSNDNFAVRPNAFASFAVTDTDWQTAGTTRALTEVTFGTVTHKAGRPLSVRATALNAAGTPAVTTNYVGAPTATLTACVGAACTATFGALTLSTTFAAGQLVSDVASYNDVGSFGLQLVDSTFSSVDAADGSTTTERNITSALINVGRFVPDHFAVALNAPVFGTACGSFSYIGQAFNYTTAPVITVTAQDFTNNTTTLYATIGSWFRITSASLTGKAYTAATGTLDVTGLPGTDPVILSAGSGMGTLTFGSGTGLFFGRTTPTAPASPYDADISLAINVIDADGVILATNPARFGTATAGNGIAFSSGKPMRFGRLTIRNANGSQLVPLPVLMEAQHWNGTAFITNTADGCTAIAAANIEMSNYTPNLNACETSLTVSAFANGRATALLSAPGSANNGSVILTPRLEASVPVGPTTCIGGVSTPVTGANRTYLLGRWDAVDQGGDGLLFDDNPAAKATFGVYKGAEEVIFIRENF